MIEVTESGFLILHEPGDLGREIYVRLEQITSIHPFGEHSHVYTTNGSIIDVEEHPADIISAIEYY